MAEASPGAPEATTTPATGLGAPKRATGEIPLSWAMPAEAVSDAPTGASPNTLILGAVAAAVAIGLAAIAATTIGGRSAPLERTAPARPDVVIVAPPPVAAPTVAAPTVEVPTVAVPPAPEPAPAVPLTPTPAPPEAAAPASLSGGTEAAAPVRPTRIRARATAARARLAARDGDRPRALALAEEAVATDPGCGGCWRTLALLRQQTGDKQGAAEARRQAAASTDPLP